MPNPHTHTALALGLLWLALAPLAGCQHHTGDDWYCITLPDLVIEDGPDFSRDACNRRLDGKLPTGHLPLHEQDIAEIRKVMQQYWRQDRGPSPSIFIGRDVTFDHWTPGKVLVTLTPGFNSAKSSMFSVYHTAHGWKVRVNNIVWQFNI